MFNKKVIKKRIVKPKFLKKNVNKLKNLLFKSQKKEQFSVSTKNYEKKKESEDTNEKSPDKNLAFKSKKKKFKKKKYCFDQNNYKYYNKVTGEWHYKSQIDPNYKRNMRNIKNVNDKYFYSRVNKKYSSNQSLLQDKLEKIKYYEEKERRNKLKHANPNSLYNGYYIGNTNTDSFCQNCDYKLKIPNIDTKFKPENQELKTKKTCCKK